MKRYRTTIIAQVEILTWHNQLPYGMERSYFIPIACETRRARIGSAIVATLLADPAIVANRADIMAFKVRIGSVVIAVDSIGSWRMGAAA